MESVNCKFLEQNKDVFISFSKFNQLDLQRLYRNPREKELTQDEINNIEYSYDLPLFIKLIFRLRQNNNCPARFFNNADWIVQGDILKIYFDVYTSLGEHNIYKDHLDFFSWIGNMVSIMEIRSMVGDISLVECWQVNTILFYYSINEDLQKKLVELYLAELVRVNQLFRQ